MSDSRVQVARQSLPYVAFILAERPVQLFASVANSQGYVTLPISNLPLGFHVATRKETGGGEGPVPAARAAARLFAAELL
jgi:hypothetical protein